MIVPYTDVVPPFSPNLQKNLRIWFQLPMFWGAKPEHGEVLVVGTLILIMLALCISAAAHLRETERKEAEKMHRRKGGSDG